MDALRSAVPLARLLLALAEQKRSVAVLVRAGARSAQLSLADGRAMALVGVDGEPLGDTLLRRGALDAARHGLALARRPPDGPVGRWLVQVGAAPEHAVRAALREQLEARIGRMLGWVSPRFELTSASARGHEADVRADVPTAVWQGLLRIANELPTGTAQALAGEGALQLTRTGARLVCAVEACGLELRVDEALAVATPRSLAARAVLRTLRAAVPEQGDGDAYSLLLRKQREIRREVSPAALLDLRPDAARPADARRALRKLAHKLHPDRFETLEPRLHALSSQVMQALSQAEARLRQDHRPRRAHARG